MKPARSKPTRRVLLLLLLLRGGAVGLVCRTPSLYFFPEPKLSN
jgi:hypothetical protein